MQLSKASAIIFSAAVLNARLSTAAPIPDTNVELGPDFLGHYSHEDFSSRGLKYPEQQLHSQWTSHDQDDNINQGFGSKARAVVDSCPSVKQLERQASNKATADQDYDAVLQKKGVVGGSSDGGDKSSPPRSPPKEKSPSNSKGKGKASLPKSKGLKKGFFGPRPTPVANLNLGLALRPPSPPRPASTPAPAPPQERPRWNRPHGFRRPPGVRIGAQRAERRPRPYPNPRPHHDSDEESQGSTMTSVGSPPPPRSQANRTPPDSPGGSATSALSDVAQAAQRLHDLFDRDVEDLYDAALEKKGSDGDEFPPVSPEGSPGKSPDSRKPDSPSKSRSSSPPRPKANAGFGGLKFGFLGRPKPEIKGEAPSARLQSPVRSPARWPPASPPPPDDPFWQLSKKKHRGRGSKGMLYPKPGLFGFVKHRKKRPRRNRNQEPLPNANPEHEIESSEGSTMTDLNDSSPSPPGRSPDRKPPGSPDGGGEGASSAFKSVISTAHQLHGLFDRDAEDPDK